MTSNNIRVKIAAPMPIENQPVAIPHRQAALDDIIGLGLLSHRTLDGYTLQINPWHIPVSQPQMQRWIEEGFAVVDLGGRKYNQNGFKSAAAYVTTMYVQGDYPLKGFTMEPLSLGEKALVELANHNNATGNLKVGSSHRLAWLLRVIYSIFPERECEIIEKSIQVVKTWIEIYDVMVVDHGTKIGKTVERPVSAEDREMLFAPYLNAGKKYLKENHLEAFNRFNQFSTEDFSIGQYLMFLGYWASLSGKPEYKKALEDAIAFWMEMVKGVKDAKDAAKIARKEKRGLSVVTQEDANLMAIVYDVPEGDERIASTVAREIFDPSEMGFHAQVLIMKTPNGNVNIRYNVAAAAYFDLKNAAEHTFHLLTDPRYKEQSMWYMQPGTLHILNGSLMHPATRTSYSVEQMVKMVLAGLRKYALAEETAEEADEQPVRPLRQPIARHTEKRSDRRSPRH